MIYLVGGAGARDYDLLYPSMDDSIRTKTCRCFVTLALIMK